MRDGSNLWRPTATLQHLKLRARLLQDVRQFFTTRDVLEVETPILSAHGSTDPQLESFITDYTGPNSDATRYYLHTSPEFAMKRLLAHGSGSIYQIAKVFRNGEYGRLHNPEFTLLEWYRVGWDASALMHEVAELIATLLPPYRLNPPQYITYREAFQRYCQVDPFAADTASLRRAALDRGIDVAAGALDHDAWCDLLLTHAIQPQLGRGHIAFLHDYPPSQAALARVRDARPPVAERFEVFIDGIELANGFFELADATEQARRFQEDNAQRTRRGLTPVKVDTHLLAALPQLPDCAGVALGFDRLVLLAAKAQALREVVAFPFDRA